MFQVVICPIGAILGQERSRKWHVGKTEVPASAQWPQFGFLGNKFLTVAGWHQGIWFGGSMQWWICGGLSRFKPH